MAAVSLSLALISCATVVQPPPLAAVPPRPQLDASYDWHGLLIVPFGSTLKETPFKVHEVLFFRDAARPAATDEAECYAMEQPAPRFVARVPDQYLLCFEHDRLSRVRATVTLPRREALHVFRDACESWQRAAAASSVPGAVPVGVSPTCEGRDGVIDYSGLLDLADAEQHDGVSMTIDLDASFEPYTP